MAVNLGGLLKNLFSIIGVQCQPLIFNIYIYNYIYIYIYTCLYTSIGSSIPSSNGLRIFSETGLDGYLRQVWSLWTPRCHQGSLRRSGKWEVWQPHSCGEDPDVMNISIR